MVGEGITKGTSATTFSSGAVVTRAQMAFLWRFAGEPPAGDSGGSRSPDARLVETRDVLTESISQYSRRVTVHTARGGSCAYFM